MNTSRFVRITSAMFCLSLLCAPVASRAGHYAINVDFGGGYTTSKVGPAATGRDINDFWNYYGNPGFVASGFVPNLRYCDGASSTVGLTISGLSGHSGTGSSDPMFADTIWPNPINVPGTATVTNLPAGQYDFYVYGPLGNYQVTVQGTNYGTKSTTNAPVVNPIAWQEGVQYVVFRNVLVGSNQAATLTVSLYSYSIYPYSSLAGLQIVESNTSPSPTNTPPAITMQPTNATVLASSNYTFRVMAAGTLPFTYQWYQDTNAVPDATNYFLGLTTVTPAQAGNYTVVVSNAFGADTSSNALLTVIPIAFASQPTSRSVLAGGTTTFTVTMQGNTPFTYQWQFYGSNLAGATASNLTLTNIQPSQAGNYSVTVSNAYGGITSSNAVLTVLLPYFNSQPQSQTALAVTTPSLSATAQATSPRYQWLFNGADLAGATNSTLTLPNVSPSQAGIYALTVSNEFGTAQSSNATLSVLLVPAWGDNQYGQSSNWVGFSNVVSVAAGFYHSIALKADGTVMAWGDNTYNQTNVPGTVTNVVAIAGGGYHSLALKGDGTVVGWGYNGVGQLNIPPGLSGVVAIAAGGGHSLALRVDGTVVAWGYNANGQANVPAGLSNVVAIAAGNNHTLALKADGGLAAWGINNYGQTNIPATLTNVVAIAAATYNSAAVKADGRVVVWGDNTYGQNNVPASVTNAVAVAVGTSHAVALRSNGLAAAWGQNGSPQISVPSGLTNVIAISAGTAHNVALVGVGSPYCSQAQFDWFVPVGGAAQFKPPAAGNWPLQYQWQFNGTNLSGATNAALKLTGLQPANSGNYSVVIANSLGTITSSPPATLTVPPPPTIDTPPQSVGVLVGSNATFTVAATGYSLSYQWRFNGANLSGATTSSYTRTNVQPADAGNYIVVVTNISGALTSTPPAVLTILFPPSIQSQPQSHNAFAGDAAAFHVVAGGTAPLSYRWFKGATPLTDDARIAGSTSSDLTINGVAFGDAGNYSVAVSNAYGTASSSNASLTVFLGLAQALGSALPWTVGGNAGWFTETNVTHDGVAAAQSGAITDGQVSTLAAAVAGPGTVTFWWKVSSEELADYLRFYISGTAKVKISGEVDWQQKTFAVPAGTQVLEWRYTKDADVAAGSDAGWLDQVRFDNGLLDTLAWNTNSGFQFRLDGLPPGTYVVLGSSNLTSWLPISTNVVSSNSPAIFVDSQSHNFPLRFYRAQQQ